MAESNNHESSAERKLVSLTKLEVALLYYRCAGHKYRTIPGLLKQIPEWQGITQDAIENNTASMYGKLDVNLKDLHPQARIRELKTTYWPVLERLLLGMPGETFEEKLEHWPPEIAHPPPPPKSLPPQVVNRALTVVRREIQIEGRELVPVPPGPLAFPLPPIPIRQRGIPLRVVILLLVLAIGVTYLLTSRRIRERIVTEIVTRVVEVTSAPAPTVTRVPTIPPTRTPYPTATPLPTPSPEPTSTPPGRGGVISGGPLEVTLQDYEFRPQEHAEPAAIKYVLEFRNAGAANVDVQFNVEGIRGRDNTGKSYEEFYTGFKRYITADPPPCLVISIVPSGGYDWSALIQTFTLAPGEAKAYELFLNPLQVQGGCTVQDHVGRVPFGTNWVDFEWVIDYHLVGANPSTLYLKWRMQRN